VAGCHKEGDEFLRKNHMWTLVNLPRNQKVVRYKWVFKKKREFQVWKDKGLRMDWW